MHTVLRKPVVDFGCDYCRDDSNRFFGHLDQIGSSEERWMILLRRPKCGALFGNRPAGPTRLGGSPKTRPAVFTLA
jgi:hypothetical protein